MSPTQTATLWIGNLPFDITRDELYELCSLFGHIDNLEGPRDPRTGRSNGWILCRYSDPESTAVAKEALSGATLGGRTIAVECSGGSDTRRTPDDGQVGKVDLLGRQRRIANMSRDELTSILVDVKNKLSHLSEKEIRNLAELHREEFEAYEKACQAVNLRG